MEFIVCPDCQGKNQNQRKHCPRCRGQEIYGWFGGHLLFLKKVFDRREISIRGLKNFLDIIIKIFLVLVGLSGLVFLIKAVSTFPNVVLPVFLQNLLNKIVFLDRDVNKLLLFFWLSILADCYFFYLVEKNRDRQIKNWPVLAKEGTVPSSWEQCQRLPTKVKINIIDAFSESSIKIMQRTWKLAYRLKHQQIEPIHLLAASLQDENIILIINRLGLDWQAIRRRIANSLAKIPKENKKREIVYSLAIKKILLNAYALAGEGESLALTPLEILQSLVSFEGAVKEIFYDLEIGLDEIKNVCLWIKIYEELRLGQYQFAGRARFKPKGPINRAYTAIATPNLDAYSQDLIQMARNGQMGICINRNREIENIFQALEGGRSGAILVGSPGVGKTTIINGLARKMVIEDVPKILQDKRLVSLNLSSLIAGASQPGAIEQRLQIIINEIARSGNIVLFIKDIHNMIGMKTTEGEMDVSEILADAMKQQLLFVIATSTPLKYRQLMEGRFIADVFQKINIEEPDKNTTIQILESQAAWIEAKERVYFSYGALNSAVDLSSRYLHEHFLPEKAINLLKEAAISVKNKKGQGSIIQKEDVAQLVAEKTNIPVTKITEKESEKLMNLEDQIHQRLIDQSEAVNMVASALRRARTELRSQSRPIVNLLFLGPTGVGKTELAKTVAEVYFGDEEKMIRLDMSEYQEKTSIERLIGTPGGQTGGYLTEAVRLNPSSILLLDEIEKAHPDILNVFLQVMDDGRLTDVLGRTIDFTNIILIGTSNAGTDFIQTEINKGTSVEAITEILIREKLKPYFRPEFLNRFDGIIVFKPLNMDEIRQITKLLLKKLTKQLEQKGIALRITEEAVNELALAGFDPAFGARPLSRVIQNRVSDVLAKFLLTGKIGRRDTVVLEKEGQIRIEKAKEI